MTEWEPVCETRDYGRTETTTKMRVPGGWVLRVTHMHTEDLTARTHYEWVQRNE